MGHEAFLPEGKEDILAEDWEIEEEKVYFTRAQVLEALDAPFLFLTKEVQAKEGHLLGESIGMILDRLGFQKKI